jgi:hypothetical protein
MQKRAKLRVPDAVIMGCKYQWYPVPTTGYRCLERQGGMVGVRME